MEPSSAGDPFVFFERSTDPILGFTRFVRRMLRTAIAVVLLVGTALAIGSAGYHWTEGWDWLDSTLNASMILTGMGPVDTLHTTGGKVFAICYALFSGVVFLSVVALVFTPLAHRMLHVFHLDREN